MKTLKNVSETVQLYGSSRKYFTILSAMISIVLYIVVAWVLREAKALSDYLATMPQFQQLYFSDLLMSYVAVSVATLLLALFIYLVMTSGNQKK